MSLSLPLHDTPAQVSFGIFVGLFRCFYVGIRLHDTPAYVSVSLSICVFDAPLWTSTHTRKDSYRLSMRVHNAPFVQVSLHKATQRHVMKLCMKKPPETYTATQPDQDRRHKETCREALEVLPYQFQDRRHKESCREPRRHTE